MKETIREKLYRIIFKTDTPAAKAFDVWLLWAIGLSVIVVMLDSVESIHSQFPVLLYRVEWVFTLIFTLEYLVRLYCVRNRHKYALSFFGVIDLLAILPSYLNLVVDGAQYLMVIRILRLLRVFRVFKLVRYLDEMSLLILALRASRAKITVFLGAVITVVVVIGASMYVIEGADHGFNNIPTGVYWAIVTLTTVGYGDLAPQTPLGKFIASFIMIMGYGIIAVPTGIVSVELQEATRKRRDHKKCDECGLEGHEIDAFFCKRCGHGLKSTQADH